jgi:hypothetical protein
MGFEGEMYNDGIILVEEDANLDFKSHEADVCNYKICLWRHRETC